MAWDIIGRLIKHELREEIMNIIDKIKMYFNVKKALDKLFKEVKDMETSGKKPGWKTTEFWVVVLTNAINVVTVLQGVIPAETFLIITTVINAIYTIMRSLAKSPEITTVVDNSVTTK